MTSRRKRPDLAAMLALVLVGCMYRSRRPRGDSLWWIVALYAAAKLFEHFDAEVLRATGLVSGHTLKHLVSAVAGYLVARMLGNRSICASALAPPRPSPLEEAREP